MPKEGVDLTEYLEGRYGPRIKTAQQHLTKVGEELGIKFVHEGKKVSDTIDSHRLIEFAAKRGKQDEMVKILFRRYAPNLFQD